MLMPLMEDPLVASQIAPLEWVSFHIFRHIVIHFWLQYRPRLNENLHKIIQQNSDIFPKLINFHAMSIEVCLLSD